MASRNLRKAVMKTKIAKQAIKITLIGISKTIKNKKIKVSDRSINPLLYWMTFSSWDWFLEDFSFLTKPPVNKNIVMHKIIELNKKIYPAKPILDNLLKLKKLLLTPQQFYHKKYLKFPQIWCFLLILLSYHLRYQ